MSEPALKAGIWVKAQLKMCDINFMSAYIVRKGDPDAGAIILVLDRFAEGCDVFTQARTIEGERGWVQAAKGKAMSREEMSAFTERQISRDPDLWILEIEDPGRKYEMDGPVI